MAAQGRVGDRRLGRQVDRLGLVVGGFVVERRPARLVVAEVVAVVHGRIVVHGRLVAQRLAAGGRLVGRRLVAGGRLVGRRLVAGRRLVGRRLVRQRRLVGRRLVAQRPLGRLLGERAPFALGTTALALDARGLAIGGAALATVLAASEEGHQPVTSRAWRTSQSSSSTAAARESSLVRGGWDMASRAAMAVVKRSS